VDTVPGMVIDSRAVQRKVSDPMDVISLEKVADVSCSHCLNILGDSTVTALGSTIEEIDVPAKAPYSILVTDWGRLISVMPEQPLNALYPMVSSYGPNAFAVGEYLIGNRRHIVGESYVLYL